MEKSTDSLLTLQQRYRQFPGRAPLDWLYDRLTLHDAPRPADLIFVLAGRMERKQYGLELYRAGLAPRLLLSIGRFEVSKLRGIDFAGTDELIARRDRTPPGERHFFCEMSAAGLRMETARVSPWNTYGEIAALREYLKPDLPRSLILVSSDLHLRRVAGTFARIFGGASVETSYCPVPAGLSSIRKEEWSTRRWDRNYVFQETVKLAAYQAILKLPDGIIRRIMWLKKRPGQPRH
jgi:DUF218 domain